MPGHDRMSSPERLVFSPSVEALLVRGVGDRMTPQLQERLRALGIDVGKPLLPAYPLDKWQEAVDAVAAALYPGVAMKEAQWKLGESTVLGFEKTMLGKAMVGVSRVIGPRRALLRFPSMSRSSNNYSTMTANEVAPGNIEMVCDPYVGWPEYVQGCLHAVMQMCGAQEPKVELVEHSPQKERLVLRALWRS